MTDGANIYLSIDTKINEAKYR